MGVLSYLRPKKVTKDAINEKSVAIPDLSGVNTGRTSRSSINSRIGEGFHNLKYEAQANYLHQQQQERMWTTGNDEDQGVVLKKSRDEYVCCPDSIASSPHGFAAAIQKLNVRAAVTIDNNFVKIILRHSHMNYITMGNGLRLQVLPDISFLPRCQKHQFAAFIADRQQLIVWDDSPQNVLPRASAILDELMEEIWNSYPDTPIDEKKVAETSEAEVFELSDEELEAAAPASLKRPIVLLLPFQIAISLCLGVTCLGVGVSKLVQETSLDGTYIRFALLLALPAQFWLCLFFFQSVSGCLVQLLGPVSQVKMNSKYYSGLPPKRLSRGGALPHVTIQMPVYKEGLEAVIVPTIRSLKAAISTYEMQGGTANIFVNDDGMQILSDDEARARQDFYDEHNIGWVARPKHNAKPADGEEVFLRRGKFKKASNMNYALWVSNRVEEKLLQVTRPQGWTQLQEAEAYVKALSEVVEEDDGRTWADGNVRMGDYILLIDSDTRVPTDCFLNAVSEMEQSPEVAIIQYTSGVMNVTDSFFEKGITFFTNMVYTQINFSVASGDVAPFVGHNAVLRWSAVQEIAYDDEDDREKFWSESTVSEDFDMALRLQAAGYIVRFGSYTGVTSGFEEGVSLTVYDELARWEKYSYGCSELVFNPLRYWFKRGPLTPLFRRFIGSVMPLASKFTILAYIGTYYAIASAWLLTAVNYFIIGWYNGWLDHYYLDSFKIYVSIIVVFYLGGNFTLAVLRYRTGEKTLLASFLENIMWIPMLTIFLGGVSIHCFQALSCHILSIDMSWGATAKEVTQTSFFEEIFKVAKAFKYTFAGCLVGVAAMIVLSSDVVPRDWRIDLFIAVWPLATTIFSHALLPIALNPNLMLFKW